MDAKTFSDTMIIERDVPITMDDGLVLRADVYRPKTAEKVPVVMTSGPYGKGVMYQEHYKLMWDWLVEQHPDLLPGSTRSFLTWETVDPEIWVPWGYAVVRVDSRGAGRSPGYLDIFSPRETRDYYNAIEWAGTQPWSNGKVGLNGISYYAINQWHVASLQPPHLTAMVPWEGAADMYRD
ncbi:MAG TPA: CocE/NonD family hydrolase, partial [Xanthobacteraceae bacterium]|nr:CocE/NonD family hydrolase [Xanthobacteraceae bacterium]